ncbi:hypothetical protein TraAM80_05721 [Trypanosoma rangeli]|uniref:Uncharacterized protein n=1 Tax=Trypanosoma rangeli TaxID=5698 RepID=A0A422ND70_TRYRA|nr:uncharacterized protein TraAM80_05721 [Trypanosoma rangeli]RNF03425.1 hypothetical protein TraAM80_05721 [Trypanosoma rangeli]|eukprot:RNF03425.1 hypothetical protein TraAM80_05721 [Trypanosoma rangeli]
MDTGADPAVVRRGPLSERVAGVLRAGKPPSRGCSSINRLAPNASTAPPRAPPHSPRRRLDENCTATPRSASTVTVLAPSVEELLVRGHDVAAGRVGTSPQRPRERPSLQDETHACQAPAPSNPERVMAAPAPQPASGVQAAQYVYSSSPPPPLLPQSPASPRQAPGREAPRHPWGTQVPPPSELQQEETSGRSSGRLSLVSLQGFSSNDLFVTGKLMLQEKISTSEVAVAEEERSFSTQREKQDAIPRGMSREPPPLPYFQKEEELAQYDSHQPRMLMTWEDSPSPWTPLCGGATPSANAAGDALLTTRRPAPRLTPLLPSLPEPGDTVTLLMVVKAASSADGGDSDDYHGNSIASYMGMGPKLVSGPIVLRVFMSRLQLETTCVFDLKMGVEHQLGVAAARQTLRANGAVLHDALPLSLLDFSVILFMDVEAPEEARVEQSKLQGNIQRLVPQRERTPVLQFHEASLSLPPSPRDCDAMLERLERCMRASATALWSSRGKTHAVNGCGSSRHAVSREDLQRGDDCIETNIYVGNGEEENVGAMHDGRGRHERDDGTAGSLQMSRPRGSPPFPPQEIPETMCGVSAAAGADAVEGPALGQRGPLEDAATRAKQQMELLAWLGRKLGRRGSGSGSSSCEAGGE